MKVSPVLLLFYTIWLSLDVGQSYRILGIFPHPGKSHFAFFYPIMQGLAERGHNVTVVSFFKNSNPHQNYNDLFFDDQESLTDSMRLDQDFVPKHLTGVYNSFYELSIWGREACERILTSPAVDQVIRLHSQHPFDVLISETFTTDCANGVAYKMNLPFIGLSSCALMPWHYERVGLPDTPSYIPSKFLGFSDKMTLFERMINWWVGKSMKFLFRHVQEIPDNDRLRRKFGDDMPDLREIVKNTSLQMVNQHYSFSGSKPLSQKVLEVGGLHIKKAKPVPSDLLEILESAKNGVILMSWGSVLRIESLPIEKRNAFFNAFQRMEQTVLLKWENSSMIDKPNNIHFRKWLPQRDILCHENVKLFISHGGMLGTSEAVYCGVPILVVPIYGDQYLNAAAVENREIGVKIFYDSISEDSIYDAMKRAQNDQTVENMKIVSTYFKNRKPLETALWWVEYVILTKGHHLAKSHSVELNWLSYHSLDVITIMIGVFSSIALIIIWLIKKVVKKLFPVKEKLH